MKNKGTHGAVICMLVMYAILAVIVGGFFLHIQEEIDEKLATIEERLDNLEERVRTIENDLTEIKE